MAENGDDVPDTREGSKSPDNREKSRESSVSKDGKDKDKESELEKYWKAVKENPNDFTGWTYLLQYVEQENHMDDARKAYDSFFCHYPYCYGYWKKYADMEKRNGDTDRAIEIFERGLKSIGLSIELWIHYINFYVGEFGSNEDAPSKIRKLYERAVTAAGMDFRSDKLWDSYIAWELTQEEKNVTYLYDRLLAIPTQLYSQHFDNFRNFVNKNNPKDILDLDEFLRLRREVVAAQSSVPDPEDDLPSDVGPLDSDAPPGLEGEETVGDETEAKKLRELIIAHREIIFKQNENEVSKRWSFEEAIRRPYFHVKPLERAQLKNWRDYLDFEIEQGVQDRITVLFERCMIACALYEDFWMKYAKYLESFSAEGVRNVYRRACNIHLPRKPYIHLAWAAFEERQENYDSAWEILSNIEKNLPGLVMISMRRISLERRQNNYEEVEQLFREYIKNATSSGVRAFFALKFARFLQKVRNNPEEARNVLCEALEKDVQCEKLLLQLVDIEYQTQPLDTDRVLEIFDKVLNKSDVSVDFKVKVSQRRMEFLEDFGICIKRITEAYDEHQKLVKDLNGDRKRKHPDVSSQPPLPRDDAPPLEKKSRVEPTTNGSTEATSHPPAPTTSGDGHPYNYHWANYNFFSAAFSNGVLGSRSRVQRITYRNFWTWLNSVCNKIDEDRIRTVGPDRACAEWLLRCGAAVRWKGFEHWEKDYNLLPATHYDRYKIEEIDASGSCIMNIGFPHLKGLKYVRVIILHDCQYLDDESLTYLPLVKDSLEILRLSSCGNITNAALEPIPQLINLKKFTMFDLPELRNRESVLLSLRAALPQCDIRYLEPEHKTPSETDTQQ